MSQIVFEIQELDDSAWRGKDYWESGGTDSFDTYEDALKYIEDNDYVLEHPSYYRIVKVETTVLTTGLELYREQRK